MSPEMAFEFEVMISPEERTLIHNAMRMGRRYFERYGLGDAGSVTVFAYRTLDQLVGGYAHRFGIPIDEARRRWSGDCSAISGPGTIFLNTSSCGWREASHHTRLKLVIHEDFHVLQNNLVGRPVMAAEHEAPVAGPRWLIEGSAEYVGWLVLAESGLERSSTAKAEQWAQAKLITVPLRLMETWTGMSAAGIDCGYALAFAAVEFLLTSTGIPISSLSSFWKAIGDGRPWPSAFQAAFGENIGTFYDSFEQTRHHT